MSSIAHVKPEDIRASLDQLSEYVCLFCCRAERADDFGPPHRIRIEFAAAKAKSLLRVSSFCDRFRRPSDSCMYTKRSTLYKACRVAQCAFHYFRLLCVCLERRSNTSITFALY